MKILIVDDEKQLVSALESILKQYKYSVDVAFDGEEGLDMALSGVYDAIVLDVMMPKMNGLAVLKELRSNKISTPVLMLSAKSETNDKVQGLNEALAIVDYFKKFKKHLPPEFMNEVALLFLRLVRCDAVWTLPMDDAEPKKKKAVKKKTVAKPAVKKETASKILVFPCALSPYKILVPVSKSIESFL